MQRNRLSEETSKKVCVICNQEKDLEEFYLKSKEGSKRYNKCKMCYTEAMRVYRREHKEAYNSTQRKWWNKNKQENVIRHKERKYGLQKGEYKLLREEQGGLCGICKDPLIGSGYLDHDHITGKARGLLCKPCNDGLGSFRDNIQSLKNAIKYLEDATVGPEEK